MPKEINRPEEDVRIEIPVGTVEDLNEIDIQRVVTRFRALPPTDKFDRNRYLDLLEETGFFSSLVDSVQKYELKRSNNTVFLDQLLKPITVDILRKTVPSNFLQKINPKLRQLSTLNKHKAEVPPSESNQSLYHVISDSRLIKVIRNGFMGLDEGSHDSVSTGELEKTLGLNGIFFMYGKEFDSSNAGGAGGTNLVLFPVDLMYQDDSICMEEELSYMNNHEPLVEDYLEPFGIYSKLMKDPRNLSKQDLTTIVIAIILACLNRVIDPDQMEESNLGGEICVNPKIITVPQMIIVEEDPGFFYDEAVATGPELSKVPFIEDERIKEALAASGESLEQDISFRILFVERVNSGIIDPWDWAYNKKAA